MMISVIVVVVVCYIFIFIFILGNIEIFLVFRQLLMQNHNHNSPSGTRAATEA